MIAQMIMTAALFVAADGQAKADLDRLQGTWVLVAMEHEGDESPADAFEGWTAEYRGNQVTLRAGDNTRRRGIVTLDPERNPKAINTWDKDGPYEDQTVPGIYQLDGDTMKLCFARPGEERPTEFTTKRGKAFLYCVYKRKK